MLRRSARILTRQPSLGPLETEVLQTLWHRPDPTTVKEIQPRFPRLAYTTLMTTLDRLYRKGLLARQRRGRAFAYSPQRSREELLAEMTSDGIIDLLPATGSCRPILSMFVEAIGRRDASMLDELEALVRATRRRRRLEDGDK